MPEDAAASNRSRIADLRLGMSRAQVIEWMGPREVVTYRERHIPDTAEFRRILRDRVIHNPYRSEAITTADGRSVELLFFFTEHRPAGPPMEELTPAVLEEGKLVGWGWLYLRQNADRLGLEPGVLETR